MTQNNVLALLYRPTIPCPRPAAFTRRWCGGDLVSRSHAPAGTPGPTACLRAPCARDRMHPASDCAGEREEP